MVSRSRSGWVAALSLLLGGVLAAGYVGPVAARADAVAAAATALPAFPGAEGFGTHTIGGRGGRVIEVTNLNDGGPGSFREAVTASGPRTVVFRVAGTIELLTPVVIRNPYLTIAGQSAPGEGITLRNGPDNRQATLAVYAHDVVVRYIRMRSGPSTLLTKGLDSLRVSTDSTRVPPIYNVVIDHVSASWGVDEVVQIGEHVSDVTVQWSVIAEGLSESVHDDEEDHSMGMLLRGGDASRISIHHNLFAHNDWRNPQVSNGGTVDIVNNVVYDYGWKAITATDVGGHTVPFAAVNNFVKPGPSTSTRLPPAAPGPAPVFHEIELEPVTGVGFEAYLSGNLGRFRTDPSQPDTDSVTPEDATYVVPAPTFSSPPITTTSATQAYQDVLADAGAVRPARDAVDERILNEVETGTGRIIDHPNDVGGWPVLDPGTPAPDVDRDGMADAWEKAWFGHLDRGRPLDSSGDADADGYTDLEEYLNGTDPTAGPSGDPRPSTPSVTVTPSDGTLTVGWSMASATDVVAYDLRYARGTAAWSSVTDVSGEATSHALSGLVNGASYVVQVRARTGAGIVSGWSSPVTAIPNPPDDVTAPTASITAPLNGSSVQGSITVKASASDDRGVASVRFSVDGVEVATDTIAPYSFAWNTSGLAVNSTHVLRATAFDGAGNNTTSAPVSVKVIDTKPPTFSGITASAGRTSATITWTTNEPSTSRVKYGLTTSYGKQSTLDPALVLGHTVVISGLTPGTTYHYRVISTDANGKTGTSSDRVFTTAP